MSFMDVVVGTALMLTVFLALSGLLRSSLVVVSLAKNKSIATAVAESQMEYVRSLTYDAVGTAGGIPSGNIPQYATTTSNGIDFATRTYIEYVDDPKDGLEGADETGITTDYKRIKVTVSYVAGGRQFAIDLVSNYAPPALETSTGGGTLRIDVVNASGAPIPGASVHIENPSISPAVDLVAFSNASGIVYLPGAATSTDYRISVSKDGYSTAETYERNTTNQNPAPGYLTVVKDQTTTGTFAIDVLTTLSLSTFTPVATSTWDDSFTDASGIGTQSNIEVSGGAVLLASSELGYAESGSVSAIALTPDYLAGWKRAAIETSLPADTDVRFKVANASGAPLPDSVLPGNSAGFTDEVDLSGVPKDTYPALTLVATLATASNTVSPSLLAWSVEYQRGPVPLPNVTFSITGGKTTGSTGAGSSLYKTQTSTATNSLGLRVLSLEWDIYQIDIPSYDVVDACNTPPYTLAPGAELEASLVLGEETTNALLVSVRSGGTSVAGAEVTLSRPGFSETVTTSACGAAYFGDLAAASDYSISASAEEETTVSASGVSVADQTFYGLTFE
jgi:hypothetical protein